MPKTLDFVGKKIGRLTVSEYVGITRDKRGHTYSTFKCVCECGNACIKTGVGLKSGKINSCGCLRRELISKNNTTHGCSNTKLYNIWIAFRKRCNNPNDPAFRNYGGRGICYSPEWDDYKAFREWAYKSGYQQDAGLTLERIDVNKGYTPDNCCWTSMKRQSNNKRNNLYLTMDGETHTLSEWCDIYNAPYGRVEARVTKLKWELKDALTIPPYKRKEK